VLASIGQLDFLSLTILESHLLSNVELVPPPATMVELRKRKAPAEAAPPPPAKKSSNSVKKAIDTAKEAVLGNSESTGATNGSAKIAVGQTIVLEGFGGELETHSGEKVTLSKLLEQSQAGVVLFTYPKANTPGCKSNYQSSLLRRL
jgi:hypothetical protein